MRAVLLPVQLHGRAFLRGGPNSFAVLHRRTVHTRSGSIRAMAAVQAPAPDVLIADLNAKYEQAHVRFEENFWSTKMGLSGASNEALAKTKTDYESFLADEDNMKAVQQALESGTATPEQEHVLRIMAKTFRVSSIPPAARHLKEKLNEMEADLGQHRGSMKLEYTGPDGEFVKGSSVQLSNKIKTDDSEAVRKAAWEGMRSIGPHIVEKLCEVVKVRNKLAKSQGFEDFYDAKTQGAEGFSKWRLFEILDGLEAESRPLMGAARKAVAAAKGEESLRPWNLSHALAGDVETKLDPYYPFEEAVDVWARTFAALGINYKDATMRLDLCDREGKYSNGFCHWPQPAWQKADGTWVPSQANFTSLATPDAVGSGKTALMTLLHEGGHAAHFANVSQGSPFFSQERAPTSVAYAETQSMFLDSLMGDGEWISRYALSRDGSVCPWELVEESLRATQPYDVFFLRSMLAVPYFEKALYELPDEKVTPEEVRALADRVEADIQGGPAGRPLLAVPHILADESSAYCHGYVLAEMAVHQTRAHFKTKYSRIVDNPRVGADLTEAYWKPGNGAAFLDLVQKLTGAPLTGDAWVGRLRTPLGEVVAEEKQGYEEGVKTGPEIKRGDGADLGMRVILVHGDKVVSDSENGGLAAAIGIFKTWVRSTWQLKGK